MLVTLSDNSVETGIRDVAVLEAMRTTKHEPMVLTETEDWFFPELPGKG